MTFFRDECPDWGVRGDYENWTPEQTAVQFMRSLLAVRPTPPDPNVRKLQILRLRMEILRLLDLASDDEIELVEKILHEFRYGDLQPDQLRTLFTILGRP